MSTFEAGQAVKISYTDGGSIFGYLYDPVVHVGDSYQASRDRVLLSGFEPLTSESTEGCTRVGVDNIERIELVSLPIASEFVIDSVRTICLFIRSLGSSVSPGFRIGGQFRTERAAKFAESFLETIACFSDENDLCFHALLGGFPTSTDLTAFGLDFFRQHYLDLRRDAIRSGTPPSNETMMTRLSITAEHRTTNRDWVPSQYSGPLS